MKLRSSSTKVARHDRQPRISHIHSSLALLYSPRDFLLTASWGCRLTRALKLTPAAPNPTVTASAFQRPPEETNDSAARSVRCTEHVRTLQKAARAFLYHLQRFSMLSHYNLVLRLLCLVFRGFFTVQASDSQIFGACQYQRRMTGALVLIRQVESRSQDVKRFAYVQSG